MKRIGWKLAACAAILAARPCAAALLIGEVLYNEVGSNTGGEWIEIYNNGAAAIDLSNYKIGDEETQSATSATEGMFQFPLGASIGAGAVQIVAVDASVFQTNYGFLPTYEVTGADASVPNLTLYTAWDPDAGLAGNTINMSNTNDQVAILDGSDAVVDAVNWGNTVYFNPGLNATTGDGRSYERTNPLVDTDAAADWQIGNPSTPGVVPGVPEPSTIGLAALAGVGLGAVRRRR